MSDRLLRNNQDSIYNQIWHDNRETYNTCKLYVLSTMGNNLKRIYMRAMHRYMVTLSLEYRHQWAGDCWSHYPWSIMNRSSQTPRTAVPPVDRQKLLLKCRLTRMAILLDNWHIKNFIWLFYFFIRQYDTTDCIFNNRTKETTWSTARRA